MSMHGICTLHEIVEAVGANEVQVVVHSPVYDCPFILAFFFCTTGRRLGCSAVMGPWAGG